VTLGSIIRSERTSRLTWVHQADNPMTYRH
jgi:hypothetical protein